MSRTEYPQLRMSWSEYLEKYARSPDEGYNHGKTEDEVYEFERELYERCLEFFGCDFEGSDLFQFMLVTKKTHDPFRWRPVPSVPMMGTQEEALNALEVTTRNLSIAMDEHDHAARTFTYYANRDKNAREKADHR